MPSRTPLTRLVEAALLGGVALLPVMDPLHVEVFGSAIIPADVLFAVAAVAWLLGRPAGHLRGIFPVTALAYLGAVLTAVVASEDVGHSIRRASIDAYVVGLGLLTYSVVRSEATRRRLAGAWLVGTVITAGAVALGLVLYAAGRDTPEHNFAQFVIGNAPAFPPRFKGLFINANMMCNYLIVAAAVVAAGWITGRLPARRAVLLAGVIALPTVFGLSPGIGGVVLAAGLALWLGSGRARWRRPVMVGAVVVAAGFFMAAVATQRPTAWAQAASAFLDRPLLGHGPGVDVVSMVVEQAGGVGTVTDPHQTWLNVAAQTGVVGVLALATLVALLAVGVARKRPLAAHPALLACWCALVGAVLYQGLTMSTEQMRHIWILIGALAGVVRDGNGSPVDSA